MSIDHYTEESTKLVKNKSLGVDKTVSTKEVVLPECVKVLEKDSKLLKNLKILEANHVLHLKDSYSSLDQMCKEVLDFRTIKFTDKGREGQEPREYKTTVEFYHIMKHVMSGNFVYTNKKELPFVYSRHYFEKYNKTTREKTFQNVMHSTDLKEKLLARAKPVTLHDLFLITANINPNERVIVKKNVISQSSFKESMMETEIVNEMLE